MFDLMKKNLNIKSPSEMTYSSTNFQEEWIWVEGYKGTTKDMTCRDYQFELGKQFDIPEGETINACKNGFHFCKELRDVYVYYGLGECHRFFKVRALTRKEEYDRYGMCDVIDGRCCLIDKLVAKSIIFERELTTDELVAATEFKDEDADFKKGVRENGIYWGQQERCIRAIVAAGYCRELAEHIHRRSGLDELAIALAKQEGVSWDTRIKILFGRN